MKKNKLIELKKRLLAVSLAGIMIGTTGCAKKDENICYSKYSNVFM